MAQVLRYPYEIIDDTTDYLQIQIFEYDAGDLTTSGAKPGTLQESIILPIPSNIQDGNSVSYGDESMNSLEAAVLSGSMDVMTGVSVDNNAQQNADVVNQALKKAYETSGLTMGSATDLATKALASGALGVFGGNVSLNSILARQEGQILNPNMELLFNGVTLRTFRFSFKITPRDKYESLEVRKIIMTLKRNMAAKGVTGNNPGGNSFLKTPNVFKLEYKKGKNSHPFLNRFKECFLKDMSVNYTGENVYAVYSDGTPISMSMDLTFQELFPIYYGDYDDPNNIKEEDGLGVGY